MRFDSCSRCVAMKSPLGEFACFAFTDGLARTEDNAEHAVQGEPQSPSYPQPTSPHVFRELRPDAAAKMNIERPALARWG